jgi:S1-C subfamily serine protease
VAWRAPAGGNAEIAETLGLKRPTGALVANVTSGSPSAKAGLKLSDLILSIDGQVIDDPNAFDYRFATVRSGARRRSTCCAAASRSS